MKPVTKLKFENGKLVASAQAGVDTDGDGQNAADMSLELKFDALEAVTEIAKSDLPWLKAVVAKFEKPSEQSEGTPV